MNKEFFIYLAILAVSTYLIRAIPFAAVRKKITNRFLRSFLYYIPYTVLSAMTFPAAFYATGSIASAALGLLAAVVLAVKGKGLTVVAVAASIAVFISDLVLKMI
ncbi:MAG: AzlD domain-containing protein [Clostridia bacterium]|nr:AzlD domain-containing protein [Clostridia bacterium]